VPDALLAFKAEPTACLGPPACTRGVCRLAPRNEARHGRPPSAVETPWVPRACQNKNKEAPLSEWMKWVLLLWPSGFFCSRAVASFPNSCCGQHLPRRPQFGDEVRAAHQERYFQGGLGLGGHLRRSQGTVSEPLQHCAVLCTQVLSTTRTSARKAAKKIMKKPVYNSSENYWPDTQ